MYGGMNWIATRIIGSIIVAAALVAVGCTMPANSTDDGGLIEVSGDKEGAGEIEEIVEIVDGGDKDKKDSGRTPASVVVDLTFDGILDPDLTVVGAIQTDGRSGQAMAFDGYHQYLSMDDSPELTLAAEGTLETWLYAYSHRPVAGILHKGNIPGFAREAWSLQFWGISGRITLRLHNDAGRVMNVMSARQLQTGRWHYVVATWDANEVKIFIDGQLDNIEDNTIGLVRDTDAPLLIGALLPDGGLGFHGVIDDVRVHDKALGEAEIADRFTDMTP